ncbi:cell division protein FtsL [Caldisalinibacter kiritimatiensis]|uniref:Cell division protein FtsL n=1 Tax=Caldisalinibacter kiritimatiensis TaxID=1304284 RepID=R1CG15_9FIRM|nr:cell division protein FtsL [Caldisalinibacter kiritimatiensis]EOD01255.1 hypothetical protein L21TH_0609 [Caldisalinibacter kiritimatiensis]
MLVAKKEVKEVTYLKHRRENTKIRKKKSVRLKLIATALLVMCLALTVLYRYAKITHAEIEIRQLDKQITDLKKEKQALALELEKIKESEWIEKQAKERLGMVYPSREQTVFVSVKNSSENKVVASNEKDSKHLFFLNAFGNIFDKMIRFIE